MIDKASERIVDVWLRAIFTAVMFWLASIGFSPFWLTAGCFLYAVLVTIYEALRVGRLRRQ